MSLTHVEKTRSFRSFQKERDDVQSLNPTHIVPKPRIDHGEGLHKLMQGAGHREKTGAESSRFSFWFTSDMQGLVVNILAMNIFCMRKA